MGHFAVIDLEMCRVPRRVRKEGLMLKNELIQIGAVLLDETYNIVDKFMTYVSPEYGRVDNFIEDLTGITNDDLKNAPVFEKAMNLFLSWIPKDTVLVAWSENDEKQIEKEAETKGIVMPEIESYAGRWIDCQKTFAEKMDNQRNYKLSEALVIANIESDPREHDALIDAENTALLFTKIESEEEFTINPYMSGDFGKVEAAYTPFAGLLESLQFAV